jgi:hypothetical protein
MARLTPALAFFLEKKDGTRDIQLWAPQHDGDRRRVLFIRCLHWRPGAFSAPQPFTIRKRDGRGCPRPRVTAGGLTMHTDKKKAGQLDRRRLLQGAGLALGAAAATTAAPAGQTVAGTDKREPQHAGYRESESVKTYYKLARF